jgi:hypothetical protein
VRPLHNRPDFLLAAALFLPLVVNNLPHLHNKGLFQHLLRLLRVFLVNR